MPPLSERDPVDQLRAWTNGRGPDGCVDAVCLEADRTMLEKVSAVLRGERGTMKVIDLCCTLRQGQAPMRN